MMRIIKPLILGFTISFALVLGFIFALTITEYYFFDKLYYRKAEVFGYSPHEWDLLAQPNSPILEERISDLRQLIHDSKSSPSNNVLGKNSVYKVALIGDSFVYGIGIKNDQRFGKKLELLLNKQRPTKVYILGQVGDSVLDNYAKYSLANKFIKPDLYIFGLVDNDLLFDSYSKYPNEKEVYESIIKKCPAPEYKYSIPKNSTWETQIIDGYFPSFQDNYSNICILRELVKDILDSKNNVVFFDFSDIKNINSGSLSGDYYSKYQQLIVKYQSVIKDLGGTVVHPSDHVKFSFQRVSSSEAHPSANTNILYAQSIYDEIITNPKYKFTSISK